MNTPKTSLIVAMAQNRCIGMDNRMPWHLPEDLKRFKALTLGKPVIMGRKTFESIHTYLNGPLPGRENIVISRSDFQTPDASVFSDLPGAVKVAQSMARKKDLDEIFIIGGAQVYEQALKLGLANRIYLTLVHKNVPGDAYFPEIHPEYWHETAREDHLEESLPYSFLTLEHR